MFAQGMSVASWKTKAVDPCVCARFVAGDNTTPDEARSKPATNRKTVLLPQPEGPTIEMNSPGWIERETSSSASVPVLKRFDALPSWTIGAAVLKGCLVKQTVGLWCVDAHEFDFFGVDIHFFQIKFLNICVVK